MKSRNRIIEGNDISIDLSMVYEICGDDEATISKMIDIFCTGIPSLLDKVNAAFASKDWDSLFKVAHSSKSSLSIIKVPGLFDWILTVEKNARTRMDLHVIDDLIPKINSTYKNVLFLLEQAFPKA